MIEPGPDLIGKVLPEEVTFETRSNVSIKYSFLEAQPHEVLSRCQTPGSGGTIVPTPEGKPL